jgi:hypothetical protein
MHTGCLKRDENRPESGRNMAIAAKWMHGWGGKLYTRARVNKP